MQLHRLHVPAHPGTLREVRHEVPIPVLDQQDLKSQGVDVTALVPGAQATDALGSCTCNAGTAHIAERWVAAGKDLGDLELFGLTLSATDAVQDEKAAILLYHNVTDQTGDPASEWPPQDVGSSGYYVAAELERLKLASTYKSASNVTGALSLLQAGTVMIGSVFFNSWEEPDSGGFVDGDGSVDALMAALDSGVAGGHETLITGIEQLAVTGGSVDLANTVLRVRNSWSADWNPVLSGDYLIHASTLDTLAQYVDYKAIAI
jgi:hypothetical protein